MTVGGRAGSEVSRKYISNLSVKLNSIACVSEKQLRNHSPHIYLCLIGVPSLVSAAFPLWMAEGAARSGGRRGKRTGRMVEGTRTVRLRSKYKHAGGREQAICSAVLSGVVSWRHHRSKRTKLAPGANVSTDDICSSAASWWFSADSRPKPGLPRLSRTHEGVFT